MLQKEIIRGTQELNIVECKHYRLGGFINGGVFFTQ